MTPPTPSPVTVPFYEEVESPLGAFVVAGDGRTVVQVHLPGTWSTDALAKTWVHERGSMAPVAEQLARYFDGTLQTFDLDLRPEGTEFQRSVWRALEAIPFATTASYRDIATAVGNSKATRAVGLANNRNPIALIVPCHRVIGADGSLTGYGGGLPMKEWLLAHERAVAASAAALADVDR